MTFDEYQMHAKETDQVPGDGPEQRIVPLLGLAGEAGELLSEYKKHLRDGQSHKLYKERIGEELGDLLWYLATVATKFGLRVDELAVANLMKARARWGEQSNYGRLPFFEFFDDSFPQAQQMPRYFCVKIKDCPEKSKVTLTAIVDGVERVFGDPLSDNAYDPDGYRFHDVFHLGFAAGLGWSPVTRKNLGRKRKNSPRVDEVEDGGRATAIEEGLSAIIFDYAKRHDFLASNPPLDYALLKLVKGNTANLEVSTRSTGDWERTIWNAYEVWRQVNLHKGGTVIVDLKAKSLSYE